MSTLRPTTLNAALASLAAGAIPIAGCTDLMVVDHAQKKRRAAVVDILRVTELQGIYERSDMIELGAVTTFSEIRGNALCQRYTPLLCEAAATVGAWQIQNRATIGGNIANASPAGDSLPVLLALGAELVIAGPMGERRMAYDHVHVGYRKTTLAPDELIVRVRVPKKGPLAVQRFRKVGTRAAQAISKVVVAWQADVEHGVFRNVRFAAGSVAAIPLRLTSAENRCEGERPTVALADAVATAVAADVKPIDDVRSTATYRAFALSRVVRRMVLSAS